MPDTHSLKLPLLVAEQAQKHVTHNEALRALDAMVQLAVKDRDLATPPGAPSDGYRTSLPRARPASGPVTPPTLRCSRTALGTFTTRTKVFAAGWRTKTFF